MFNMVVRRFPTENGCTLGQLFINGNYECDTREDPVREVPGMPVSHWKIVHDTAIPRGRYSVVIEESHKFQKKMPLLQRVEGFTGVLIHAGATAANTYGCILVGQRLSNSRLTNQFPAFEALFAKITMARELGDDVTIEVQ